MELPQVNPADLDRLQNPDERKQFVGNALFPLIASKFGDEHAPMVTGMLIEEDHFDFRRLLTDGAYLLEASRMAFESIPKTGGQ
jgi:hypothetical protein